MALIPVTVKYKSTLSETSLPASILVVDFTVTFTWLCVPGAVKPELTGNNNCLISKTRLIFCSQFNPSTINFNLTDLYSRIRKIDHIELLPVSERNLREALKFITDINSYEIGDNEINYLMTHSKRSIANLVRIIYELDQLSLQLKRKITIPLIKELIQR